jgi:hypothetical protein
MAEPISFEREALKRRLGDCPGLEEALDKLMAWKAIPLADKFDCADEYVSHVRAGLKPPVAIVNMAGQLIRKIAPVPFGRKSS